MAVALEQFVKQLTDSGVIAPGKLEKFIPPQAAPKDAQELAKELVRQKHLTKFQAQEIYLGRQKSLILGNYTILDKIGAGGMGQVFKAHHRRMERVVAIKMLPTATMKDAAATARFQREVVAAAKLSHANIVAAHDADEANGVHFLVMEYAEGSDLSALVKKNGPLPVAKAVNYILQAARGLEFAHKHGVVHRDIKPANLLLSSEGTVKILDMGLARIDSEGDTATQAELTGTGMVLGTVDYMAPEQALDTKHVDGRADIYSLGCSLYYLITAHAAYNGNSLMAKLLAHREQPIPSLGAEVPEELQAVFQRMVAKKIQDRYQTMTEVVAALEQCSSSQPTSGSFQQSVSTSPDADVLTFLRDIPTRTTQKPKPKAKPVNYAAPVKTGNRNRKLVLGAVGAGLLGLAILAGVLLKLRTKDGTLVVEVSQPDAVVQVLDADGKVEISQPGGKGAISISVDPGKHRLKVEKDGFQFFAQDFEMESGGTASIKATLEPVTAVAGQSDKPWNSLAFQKWMKDVAAIPAEKQVDAVAKKLQELNPGFDGKVSGEWGNDTPKIENGVVTEMGFATGNVTDISPVRALIGLKRLSCPGSFEFSNGGHWSNLSDLSPLQGMKLTDLNCYKTSVSDLSPLKGMPLTHLYCWTTAVSDLSPLRGMPLTELGCNDCDRVSDLTPLEDTKLATLTMNGTKVVDLSPLKKMQLVNISCYGCPVADLSPLANCKSLQSLDIRSTKVTAASVAALQKALPNCKIEWDEPATIKATLIEDKPWFKPAFLEWQKEVAAMPAEEQVKAVVKKLKELNFGFDGRVTPKIEGGVVTEVEFVTDNLTDISPVRALTGLKKLVCHGSGQGKGILSDLSPLKGIPLTRMDCGWTKVSDLSPLEGMPLVDLNCGTTHVSDLSPLRGMPLTLLGCEATNVLDLSPLKGMPLKILSCHSTQLNDLSPLKGMPLTELRLYDTHVSDLSPLAGLQLSTCLFTPRNITKGMGIIRQMKSLKGIGVSREEKQFPPEEFWKKYDAGDFGKPTQSAKPITNINDPAFQQWMKTVAALPAEQQVEAVAKKLQQLNSGFDGKLTDYDEQGTPKIEGGVVTELGFRTANVSDISPVRALAGLKALNCWGDPVSDLSPLEALSLTRLNCDGTQIHDLSPLSGMRLTLLQCDHTGVADLSPLQGMSLTILHCRDTQVADLSPLKGIQLTELFCDRTLISDLSPLKGMPLTTLYCNLTKVSDFSPLEGTNLKSLWLTPKNITTGIDVIRRMKGLSTFALGWGKPEYSPAEFWKKYDAGEFGKPASLPTPAK